MTKQPEEHSPEDALNFFIDMAISTGRVYLTDGFENLDKQSILKIEKWLSTHNDKKAEKKIRALLGGKQ